MKKRYTIFFVINLFFSALCTSQDLAINEVMASNDSTIQDNDGDYEDWIEIYNYGTVAVNLEGFGLTDDPAVPFLWTFPAYIIQPNEFLLVWASDKDIAEVGQALHTNFKISSGGEDVILTNPEGGLVDQVPAVDLETDVSYGRQPDGTGDWLFFYTSTPGVSNTGTGLTELMTPPIFSHDSGLYNSSFDLTISHSNPNAEIIYTLDGSEPEQSNLAGTSFNYKNEYPLQTTDSPGPLLSGSYISNTYTASISIDDRSSEPDHLTTKNPHQFELITPIDPVRKATVIKAKAYVDGIASETVSKTFFVWAGGNPYDIPVISLQIQEDYLFDYNDGIYTSGVDFDTWRAENPDNNQYWRPEWSNYWRRGRDWEYPTSIEMFEPTSLNVVMNVNGGLRIHGNNSRARAIKNLRLYARSEYGGENTFEHDLFNVTIPDATLPNNTEFKRIMLRGNGSGGPVSYDVVFNRAMQPIYNGVARIQPAIHFINGEYWGLTAIRDRIDEHHFALNFDLDDEEIAIVGCRGVNCGLDEGEDADFDDYIAMRDFILNNDMADDANYEQAASLLDMKSYIDHMVLEIFSANDSYERNFWKVRTPVDNNYGDGKWRVTVQDFEASLNDDINWLGHWADPVNSSNEALLSSLIDNTDFQHQFMNRFADILNTVLGTSYFNDVVNFTFAEVSPYLVEDQDRYPKTDFYDSAEQSTLLSWGNTRPAAQREQIKNYFSLNSILDLTLNVSDAEAGFVRINTIEIQEETPGVAASPYPWTGKYFEAIPVSIEATAFPGYEFSHWSGDVSGTDPVLNITPSANMEIQANFEAIENPSEVVYFWLMDSNIPNDTPLTGLDATYASNELSATINYTSCLSGYPFTSDDPEWRTASLERKNSPTELNYVAEANNDIPYSADIMRGVQVKQPFRSGTLENYLEFVMPTTDLENIKFSFAVETNGAAESLLIDYWDGNAWSTDNLSNATESVPGDYEIMEFDFSNVSIANNNPDFRVRMRFDGADMFVDNGDEVRFNNIALRGESTLASKEFVQQNSIKVYPNPTYNFVKIEASHELKKLELFDILGKKVREYSVRGTQKQINLEELSAGIYLLKVSADGQHTTVKLIKQ
ncbi:MULTISPECIES: CotH kinase family protein [Mesonia]|uniref:Uncharacterized protein n=1 Tax=Mesonia oceanica TaxID=2687242 RepID=A0AC61YAU9_9FLAO|nr:MULTISPECIES: CotH kinase family protein [Mesonia]MAN28150.1 hypothetical protein [Mesonia sp.]MAQ39496.1 hypothetical protein [Mesonia sp.]VVV01619.1 hypothetical protein FVB9532_02912 [Mesonia oceanica]|tara:strand:+ start:4279 stop:7596 length:3318 start_codon:yes stop_codon:yes gene_type:complete